MLILLLFLHTAPVGVISGGGVAGIVIVILIILAAIFAVSVVLVILKLKKRTKVELAEGFARFS